MMFDSYKDWYLYLGVMEAMEDKWTDVNGINKQLTEECQNFYYFGWLMAKEGMKK